MSKFTQGIYKPINPEKYRGDVKNIIYRSSWESTVLFRLDTDPNVIAFSSEEIIIPYRDVNGKVRRYFPDMYVKRKIGDEIVEQLIEIKPYKETIPPILTEGKRTKTKIREVLTYDTNQRKWASAREFCKKKGWQFVILTEKEIFNKR